MDVPPNDAPVVILIPLFNDWTAATTLLENLDSELAAAGFCNVRVLLVDDGSTRPVPPSLSQLPLRCLLGVDVLSLRRNLGHQRAIAVGLCYIEENIACDAIVVMDGDGEDKPSDVPVLLRKYLECGPQTAIFAERARRTETFTFRLFYKFYKAIHLFLTGEAVRVGNFSVLPRPLLTRLVVVSDLWNHYAAAVFKAHLPREFVPLARGFRYDGKSHMNFVSLVVHGLSAMSVYGDRIGVRLLMVTSAAIALLFVGLAATLIARFALQQQISPWIVYTLLLALILLPQFLMLSLIFVFLVLAGRDSSAFLPLRDYTYYYLDLRPLITPPPAITADAREPSDVG